MMKVRTQKLLSVLCLLALLLGLLPLGVSAAGKVNIYDAGGWLESAYAEWTIDTSYAGYHAYVKSTSASDWTPVDDPLVRQYPDHMRVDALGLKAGTYQIKVVPYQSNGNEDADAAATTGNLIVEPHIREGYAFEKGGIPGAYKLDGTLKDGATVIYITEENKDTCTVTLPDKKGNNVELKGVQAIITGLKANEKVGPVDIRLIGNISDPAGMPKGDLLVDDVSCGFTIEGVGNDAVANGFGIVVKNSSQVEIRNLAVMNCNSSEGDDIGLQQKNDHVWVHNNDLFYGDAGKDADQVKGDGALDTKTSSYVTHSFNHFWDCGKCNLQGMKSESVENYITYHHNWFDHSDSRHPRIRKCTVHIYNNYYDGNAKYGVGVTSGSSTFVEKNYFRSCKYPMLISMQGSDIAEGDGTFSGEDGGVIKAFDNQFAGSYKGVVYYQANPTEFDAYLASRRDEQVPPNVKAKQGNTGYSNFDTADDFYDYDPETAEQAVETVKKYAGRVQGGDFDWQFNNDVDDASYDVNQGLKDAVVKYKTSLVKVGGNIDGVTVAPHTTHTWGTYEVDTPATCQTEGRKTAKCTYPGCTATNTISYTGTHEYVEGVCRYCGTKEGEDSGGTTGGGSSSGGSTTPGGTGSAGGSSYYLKASDFVIEAANTAQEPISSKEMKEKTKNGFDVGGAENQVLKRIKKAVTTANTTATFVEVPKDGSAYITFTVTNAPAQLIVAFSSTKESDTTQTTVLSLLGPDGDTAVKDKNGNTTNKSNTSKTQTMVTYDNLAAGTYKIVGTTDGTNNPRISTATLTETANPHTHDWENGTATGWEVSKEATCGTDGVEKRVCKNSDGNCTLPLVDGKHTETRDIDATGEHTWGGWTGPDENGELTRTCTTCGETKSIASGEPVEGTVTGVTVTPDQLTLEAGKSGQLTATLTVETTSTEPGTTPGGSTGGGTTEPGGTGGSTGGDSGSTTEPTSKVTPIPVGTTTCAKDWWDGQASVSDSVSKDGYVALEGTPNAYSSSNYKLPDGTEITQGYRIKSANIFYVIPAAPCTVTVYYFSSNAGRSLNLHYPNADTSVASEEVVKGSGSVSCTISEVQANGQLRISATDNVYIAAIEVSTPTAAASALALNEVEALAANTETVDATPGQVTWKSSNDAVATVDATGMVTAVAEGQATITAAYAEDETVKGTCSVTVTAPATVPVNSVTVSPATLSLKVNGSSTLTATVLPANATDKDVTWSSDNIGVATVDATTGKVTAVKAGTATITATAGGKSGTCTVTVTADTQPGEETVEVTSVTVSPATLSLKVNGSSTLTATVLPANATDKTVTWSSDNTAVATVDATTGKVTAVAAGTATITATAGGKSGTCTVTVTAETQPGEETVEVTSVTVSPAALSLEENESATLTATVLPANATDKTVTWKSSNTGVATVENGKVTAVKAGTATITATAGGKSGTCTVTVTAAKPDETRVTSVVVAPASTGLTAGGTVQLTATVLPDNATNKDVTWKSSNDAVATVDETGMVTAVAEGKATITATADGKSGTATITVRAEGETHEAVTGVTLSGDNTVQVDSSITLTATVTPEDGLYDHIYWVSGDTTILTVDQGGQVTGVATGSAIVTAYVMPTAENAVTDDTVRAFQQITVEAKASSSGPASGTGSTGHTTGGGHTGTTTAPSTTPSFVDVTALDWFADAVKTVAEKGLMQGVDSTHFAPGTTTTRAMVATVLFRMDGAKKTTGKVSFADLVSGSWYDDAIQWATENGIVIGYDATHFGPNDDVTREQLVTMLYRYAKSPKVDAAMGMAGFEDVASISDWAQDAMRWAVQNGILTGKDGARLDPQGNATRAEVATILARFLEKI